jgi:hypothetical protein
MGIAESSTLTATEPSDDTLAQSSDGTVPGLAELVSTVLGAEVLGDPIISAFQSAMQHMEWAEEEIESMGQAHPEHADRIWHSFALLRPTHDLMKTEFVYRSHCRELLQRVAAGEDTRPGTAAECCIACCETSQHAPMNIGGVGFYMCMWSKAAFPDLDFPREHHEAIAGEVIDDRERDIRRKLSCDWRQLPMVITHSPQCPAIRAAATTTLF